MDQWLISHVKGSMITLSLLVHIVQIWADFHPGVPDNQISTLAKVIYNTISTAVAPKKID